MILCSFVQIMLLKNIGNINTTKRVEQLRKMCKKKIILLL